MGKTIYTHDKAAQITEIFERVLSEYNIKVPSPEDDDREEDDDIGLYGSTYSDVLDDVESAIIDILDEAGVTNYIRDQFSGTY